MVPERNGDGSIQLWGTFSPRMAVIHNNGGVNYRALCALPDLKGKQNMLIAKLPGLHPLTSAPLVSGVILQDAELAGEAVHLHIDKREQDNEAFMEALVQVPTFRIWDGYEVIGQIDMVILSQVPALRLVPPIEPDALPAMAAGGVMHYYNGFQS